MAIIKFATTANIDDFEDKILEQVKIHSNFIGSVAKRHNALYQAYKNGIINLEALNNGLSQLRTFAFEYDEHLASCSKNIEQFQINLKPRKDDK